MLAGDLGGVDAEIMGIHGIPVLTLHRQGGVTSGVDPRKPQRGGIDRANLVDERGRETQARQIPADLVGKEAIDVARVTVARIDEEPGGH